MPIYWKYWDSLKKRKKFLHGVIIISSVLFSLVIILDIALIIFFNAELWKILLWTSIVLLIQRKDIRGIYCSLGEIRRIEKNIIKWFSWEERVAKILNQLVTDNPKVTVFHDVFLGHENIDHVVIYDDNIVIIVETKAWKQFPYGLKFFGVHHQIQRQWNFLHRKTWLYIHPLCVFTDTFVEKYKHHKETDYINISFLEKKIYHIIEENGYHYNQNAVSKIKSIQENYIPRKYSYFSLFFEW